MGVGARVSAVSEGNEIVWTSALDPVVVSSATSLARSVSAWKMLPKA